VTTDEFTPLRALYIVPSLDRRTGGPAYAGAQKWCTANNRVDTSLDESGEYIHLEGRLATLRNPDDLLPFEEHGSSVDETRRS
jgi:hypothetical protein